jgi:hypothetical protein
LLIRGAGPRRRSLNLASLAFACRLDRFEGVGELAEESSYATRVHACSPAQPCGFAPRGQLAQRLRHVLCLPIMRILTMGVVLSLAACSGSDEGEPCDLAHRDGTYLLRYQARDGANCGELPDTVVRLDADAPLSPECSLDAPDDVSGDQCDFTRSFTCATADPDGTVQGVAITKERGGGAQLVGLYTVTIRDAAGEYVCSGTYDMSAVRQ